MKKFIREVRSAFERGEEPHKEPEVLETLYSEIGFGTTTIAKRVFEGDVAPRTIRKYLRRAELTEYEEKVSLTYGSNGNINITHRDHEVPIHRLLATLKVNTVSDLDGTRVFFKDECPSHVSLSNLSVGPKA